MKRLFFVLSIIIFLVPSIYAQKERKFLRKGNADYENQKYSDAEILYRKALEKDASSFNAQFNLNDALYKQKKFEEASKSFQDLSGSKSSKDNLSKVYHNMGNSYFQMQKYQESVNAYKNALRQNPMDNQTRYNLAYAQQMLKQQQQKNNQDKNKDNKDKKDQKDKQNKEDQDKQKKQDQDQKQDQQQKNKISKEDAERILQSMQNDEKDVLKKLEEKKAKANKVTVLKNW